MHWVLLGFLRCPLLCGFWVFVGLRSRGCEPVFPQVFLIIPPAVVLRLATRSLKSDDDEDLEEDEDVEDEWRAPIRIRLPLAPCPLAPGGSARFHAPHGCMPPLPAPHGCRPPLQRTPRPFAPLNEGPLCPTRVRARW